MAIRNWHRGKLIILWGWGIGIDSLLMTDFLTHSTTLFVGRLTAELAFMLTSLLALSIVTWRWLGDKEDDRNSSRDRAPNSSALRSALALARRRVTRSAGKSEGLLSCPPGTA